MDISSLLGGMGVGLVNTTFSVFNAGFQGATSLMSTALQGARQYQTESIAFARSMGLSYKESQAYMSTLIRRAEKLGWQYGVDAEMVLELQKNIAEATNKQIMLNDEEAERLLQINKLVGSQTANQFVQEMMNGMGAQLSTVQGAISKAYATATKSGLNAAKFSDTVAKNLSMANRLSFRNGVDGLIRMAAFSEKIGMNMQSIESAAGQFLELDQAIQNAAKMQMLGGSAAVNFGNPLTAAYEANYDPEAFAKRLSNSLANYASFDATKGIANINGMNMDFVRNIAKTMGISTEEASRMAKKQSEIRYKEGAFGATLGQYSPEERDFILNKSYVKNGRLMITGANGEPIDITQGKLSSNLIQELSKYENKSDRDIMEIQAKSLTSIDEKLKGLDTSAVAKLAKGASSSIEGINKLLKNTGDAILEQVDKIAKHINKEIDYIVKKLNDNQDLINKVIKGIGSLISFVTDHFLVFAGIGLALKGLAFLTSQFANGAMTFGAIKNMFGGGGGATRSAPAAAKPAVTPTAKPAANPKISVGNNGQYEYFSQNGRNYRVNTQTGKYEEYFGSKGWKNPKVKNLDEVYKIKGGKTVMPKASGAVPKASTAAPKASGAVSKTSSTALKTAGKTGGRVLGASASVAFGAIEGGLGVHEYREIMKDLKVALEEGKITQEEYNAKIKEAKQYKNEALGAGIGTGVGGVLGSLADEVLGPLGTILGGILGNLLGGLAGRAWNTVSETISDFWNGTFKNLAKNFFGDFGANMTDAIGSFVDGLTDSWGYQLEAIFGLVGDIVVGWWEGFKGGFTSIWDGFVKLFHRDITGLIDIVKGPFIFAEKSFKGIYDGIKTFFTTLADSFTPFLNGIKGFLTKSGLLDFARSKIGFSEGGVVGGNSREGDRVLARVNSGEMVLNTVQQSSLFKFIKSVPSVISSMIVPKNDIVSKPIGEKEYIYIPNKSETSNINGNTITVKDFNINLNGTIKLDSGNSSKNIDVNALLNDHQFISNLKELIKSSINTDMNGGRFMNDLATMRGHVSPSSIIGR